LRKLVVIIGVVAVVGLLLAYFVGPGGGARSQPSGDAENISTTHEIPAIDLDRPAVTETAAFAFG
jgi:hypothetical protein